MKIQRKVEQAMGLLHIFMRQPQEISRLKSRFR